MSKTVFTDGNPLLGILATIVPAAWLNKVFSHVHDGLNQDGSAPLIPALPSYSGLSIKNNVGSPNTKLDISCASAILTSALGVAQLATNVNKTLNIAATGPNGVRAGLALEPSTWYSVYMIGNADGTSTDLFMDSSSGTSVPAVPTLPAGYTFAEFLTECRLDSASHLPVVDQTDNEFFFNPFVAAISSGSATELTDVTPSAFVPPTAKRVKGFFELTGGSSYSSCFLASSTAGAGTKQYTVPPLGYVLGSEFECALPLCYYSYGAGSLTTLYLSSFEY